MSVNENILSASVSAVADEPKSKEAVSFRYIPALDGLRGIAILTVMIYHLEGLIPALHPYVKGGFLGVDIFFVLSGFLITSILLKEYEKEGQISLKNFYLRRFFRLAPAFWTFLLALYFLGNVILPDRQAEAIYNNNNFFFAFSYLMNWHSATNDGLSGNLNHAWSLAIEEQFYILWSLILYKAFDEKRERKQIFAFTSATVLILIVLRAVRALNGVDTNVLYYSTDTRIDALLIGCVAAMIHTWRLLPQKLYSNRLFSVAVLMSAATALLVLFTFSHEDKFLYCGPLSIFSMSVGLTILWLTTRQKSIVKKLLELRFLRWVGQISYGLYLWHYAFYEFGRKTFDAVPIQISVGLCLAFAVSAVSFYLIEKPFLKIKEKFGS